MSIEIIQHEHDVLRRTAEAVVPAEFGSDELTAILTDMRTALAETPDGVAIAAPQIGISKRIFVVAGRVFDDLNNADENTSSPKVYINPEIIKHARKTELMHEGCLSVRHYYGYTPRYPKVTIRAQDEHGGSFTEGRGGLLAHIFQHEIDHLDGVLFIDKARDVEYRKYDAPPGDETE